MPINLGATAVTVVIRDFERVLKTTKTGARVAEACFCVNDAHSADNYAHGHASRRFGGAALILTVLLKAGQFSTVVLLPQQNCILQTCIVIIHLHFTKI